MVRQITRRVEPRVNGEVSGLQTLDRPRMPRVSCVVEKATGEEANLARVRDRGELHAHLNGSIPLATVREILDDEGTMLPVGFRIDRDLVRRTHAHPWQHI